MKKYIFLLALVFSGMSFYAQDVEIKYNGSGCYTLIERSDLRRYENNRYIGLTSREVRSFVTPVSGEKENCYYFEGNFYVQEGTKRNMAMAALGLDDSIYSKFMICEDGDLIMIKDNGYPTFRSFPVFTKNKIKIGDKWASSSIRTVDPLNKGIWTKLPMTVEYTYLRDDIFHEENVYVIGAEWATRYGISNWDFGGDNTLKTAYGSHKAQILVSKNTGNAIVVRDTVDETFEYTDGLKLTNRGSINLFTEYPPAFDRSQIYGSLANLTGVKKSELEEVLNNQEKAVEKVPSKTVEKTENKTNLPQKTEKPVVPKQKYIEKNNIKIENTKAGIRLTMQQLKFYPDSAELLPGESVRLDEIAKVLLETGDRMLLIEGHTAATGNPKGEMELSKQRAISIAKELSQRGIDMGRLMTKGSGGTKPVADNETSEGKALNRRVEITILE